LSSTNESCTCEETLTLTKLLTNYKGLKEDNSSCIMFDFKAVLKIR